MKKAVLLGLALLVTACSTQQNATKSVESTSINKSVSGEKLFFEKVSEPVSFDALKINSKLEIKGNKLSINNVDAVFYIENQQKIWANFSVMFFSVARGLATPSKVQGYEKIGKNYIDTDYSYLNQLLNVNFIDYKSFQNLLLGRTFVDVKNDRNYELIKKDTEGYTLKSKDGIKMMVNGIEKTYQINFVYNTHFQLENSHIVEEGTKNSLDIDYSGWIMVNNIFLPKNVKIIIKGQKNMDILIENTKFDFSKMNASYSVPGNYKKITIK
ncbi:DUF4292 domain-containing protein [Riemerella columbipharyngis]|uniref:DUF4292 domain-containing protein n=1 Tax=Riemerella columbipharyngis TaxID=1071918 RepID=A0A1G7CVA7_9FLAO|nr:DUF4292 domain-containing protein [Riemerella columbipharyngis]SDE43171.1 protein of unknown function [Riemerella columbipharyngis]